MIKNYNLFNNLIIMTKSTYIQTRTLITIQKIKQLIKMWNGLKTSPPTLHDLTRCPPNTPTKFCDEEWVLQNGDKTEQLWELSFFSSNSLNFEQKLFKIAQIFLCRRFKFSWHKLRLCKIDCLQSQNIFKNSTNHKRNCNKILVNFIFSI
jgi:hypothetical protein